MFVTVLIALRLDVQARTWPMFKKFFPLLILTILSLLVTYPNFAIIVSLYAILAMVILHNSIRKEQLETASWFEGTGSKTGQKW